MKQSVFKKKISVTGSKRTVDGFVVVTMNDRVHSEFPIRAQHKVVAFVGETQWDFKCNLVEEGEVVEAVKDMSDRLEKHLTEIAEQEAEKTFLHELAELGLFLVHEKHL